MTLLTIYRACDLSYLNLNFFLYKMGKIIAVVLLRRHNKLWPSEWLKQQKFIVSLFSKLEIQDQGVSQ
jgi:hypothetical protein